MTHSAGSETTQSTAFKNGMVSQPYKYILYLTQVMEGSPYGKIYLFKTLVAWKVK
jgi:hypothetical protein